MLTGKIHIETKKSKEQLLVETEFEGKTQWREINTLPSDYQKQIVASNEAYAKFIDRPNDIDRN